MSSIRINSITVENYRSFGTAQTFRFPDSTYTKPVAIVGYNNAGKTTLMRAIKYGLNEWITDDTFTLKDFHNCNYKNVPLIELNFTANGLVEDAIADNVEYTNTVGAHLEENNLILPTDHCNATFYKGKYFSKKAVIRKKTQIFYINFHTIKDEISTQKTSWGNLRSFLGKHIKKLVESDELMQSRKIEFESSIKKATLNVLSGSTLDAFIKKIKMYYTVNLRDNFCDVDFRLPDYEDIFLQMIFKVGLNKKISSLMPIEYFGDGYVSMFVMAVIRAIGETNGDPCVFLFEEPESFLHENHQEYFYKTVLCGLAEKGHQVIYTTHSDRMVDVFDTKGLIRIEFDEDECQTVKKYNDIGEFMAYDPPSTQGLLALGEFNQYIKAIEPNLNRILFSKKVLLVEGPNDVMAYKYAIEKKLKSRGKDAKSAETYLNFQNISIVPHHGKSTALLLIQLCKHLKLQFFVITDWDMTDNVDLSTFDSIDELHKSDLYKTSDRTRKAILTNNFNLLKSTESKNIHFNNPKLEGVLNYSLVDAEQSALEFKQKGDSVFLWNKLHEFENFPVEFFPESLEKFLEIDKIDGSKLEVSEGQPLTSEFDDIPFQ